MTITPVPDAGYQVGTVSVTDRFGQAVAVDQQADGTYTFVMPDGQVTVEVTFLQGEAPDLPFSDVTESDWFYDAVTYAYENGLMDGVGMGLFAPNSETTRAQLVTILHRLAGQPAPSGDSGFSDVETGTWYTDAVAWAAQNGIVNGVSDTQFAPRGRHHPGAAGGDPVPVCDLPGLRRQPAGRPVRLCGCRHHQYLCPGGPVLGQRPGPGAGL